MLELCVLNFKSESRTQGQWHFISSPCDPGIVTANFGRSKLRLCVLSLTCGALLCGVEWIKKQTQLQRRGAKLEFFISLSLRFCVSSSVDRPSVASRAEVKEISLKNHLKIAPED